jgi:hypothetical protein
MSAPGSTTRRAVAAEAAVAGADAGDTVALEQHRLRREPHEQIGAGGLDLPGQPFHELVQRDDVVAVVPERRRGHRQPQLPVGRQQIDAVGRHLAAERRALGREVRDQLPQRGRIEQRPRQRMGPGLARLLDDGDGQRLATLGRLELGQAQRRRQAGRAGADDEDVYVEGLAFHGGPAGPQPFPSSAMSAGAISNRSPSMP